MSAAPRVLGCYGGTFDPVHVAHLLCAQDAHEQLRLDRLWFIPAPAAPLRGEALAPAEDRYEMLRRAIGSDDRFAVSRVELERPGPSYTWDTVEALHALLPGVRLVWILGADQVEKLPSWHRARELVQRVEFACFERPGYSAQPPAGLEGLRLHRLESRGLEISAHEIRDRLTNGRPARFLVSDPVLDYIAARGLYRAPSNA